jgi:hypothetical protein
MSATDTLEPQAVNDRGSKDAVASWSPLRRENFSGCADIGYFPSYLFIRRRICRSLLAWRQEISGSSLLVETDLIDLAPHFIDGGRKAVGPLAQHLQVLAFIGALLA